jgi:hypothetical protein
MGMEDAYLDVLQNIEFGIIAEFRKDRSILDSDALEAVNALVRYFDVGRHGAPLGIRSQRIFDSVRENVKWRLEPNGGEPPPNTTIEMVKCLKRIASSISFWTKERGRQGYLVFVEEHMGPMFGDAIDDSEE